jgi:hypothetical protein
MSEVPTSSACGGLLGMGYLFLSLERLKVRLWRKMMKVKVKVTSNFPLWKRGIKGDSY